MSLIEDFRQAWCGLRNAPAFLALAGTVLALGLGATIFMYTMINTTMQKPPPFPEAERLYAVTGAEPARNEYSDGVAYLDFLELRAQQRTFEDLAGWYSGTMVVSGRDMPERYSGGFVTWNLLRVLRVQPLLGRDFTESDAAPNAAPVAILGYDLWRTRFNRDPNVLGQVVRVNSRPTTIIGVAPEGFTYPNNESLWIPQVRDHMNERRGDPNAIDISVIGRLKDGVTPLQAADDLAAIAARLAKEHPQTNAGTTTHLQPIASATLGREGRSLLYTLFGAVWLVLLIACANVASLIFVRANFRVYEASMRVALGATRARLMVQMLAESIIVSLVGLLAGLALAALGAYALERALQDMVNAPPAWWRFTIDGRVVLFAAGAALLSGLLAGIMPAIRASRPDVMRILRDGGRTGTGLRLSKFTAAMVIVEVALSAALLTGAALMTRTGFQSLQRDYGADVRGFMSARIGLPESTYAPQQQARFFERIVAELAAQPGVLAATAANVMPGAGVGHVRFAIDGRVYENRTDYPRAHMVTILPGFFDTFGRPLLAGRDLNSADRADAPDVVIVNDAFARKHFPAGTALGQRIRISPDEDAAEWATIVGIAANINHDVGWDEGGEFTPTFYRPLTQAPWRFMTVAIKTQGDPHAYANLLRETTRRLDPDLAIYWPLTLEEFQAQNRAPLRLLAQVFGIFAGIAIVLAAVGIYGVLSFATGQRNREIGVRRALGARDRQILTTVMRSALVQLVVGLGLGLVLAPLMARGLGDSLLGMSPDDPAVYASVFSLIIVAALLASWLPAARALRVQPAVALRHE